ncbi:hypothetical protein DLAC_01968 [Tieghemostelium lacteum]|uniref:Uncharacterized protein n=1 Tax=Tieghemostelium lacteum TaxID=361077 RepID=A0A152A5K7_TIELA|nr:hypothetical protein DLAC_01968 [Tieghemostelium lacteum]|eukprot:KYR01381.1 hypothetical protein DLAC_01968 [Tieghemostelium lacteum]
MSIVFPNIVLLEIFQKYSDLFLSESQYHYRHAHQSYIRTFIKKLLLVSKDFKNILKKIQFNYVEIPIGDIKSFVNVCNVTGGYKHVKLNCGDEPKSDDDIQRFSDSIRKSKSSLMVEISKSVKSAWDKVLPRLPQDQVTGVNLLSSTLFKFSEGSCNLENLNTLILVAYMKHEDDNNLISLLTADGVYSRDSIRNLVVSRFPLVKSTFSRIQMGNLRKLEFTSGDSGILNGQPVIDFILQNPHLKKLKVHYEISRNLFEMDKFFQNACKLKELKTLEINPSFKITPDSEIALIQYLNSTVTLKKFYTFIPLTKSIAQVNENKGLPLLIENTSITHIKGPLNLLSLWVDKSHILSFHLLSTKGDQITDYTLIDLKTLVNLESIHLERQKELISPILSHCTNLKQLKLKFYSEKYDIEETVQSIISHKSLETFQIDSSRGVGDSPTDLTNALIKLCEFHHPSLQEIRITNLHSQITRESDFINALCTNKNLKYIYLFNSLSKETELNNQIQIISRNSNLEQLYLLEQSVQHHTPDTDQVNTLSKLIRTNRNLIALQMTTNHPSIEDAFKHSQISRIYRSKWNRYNKFPKLF